MYWNGSEGRWWSIYNKLRHICIEDGQYDVLPWNDEKENNQSEIERFYRNAKHGPNLVEKQDSHKFLLNVYKDYRPFDFHDMQIINLGRHSLQKNDILGDSTRILLNFREYSGRNAILKKAKQNHTQQKKTG